MDFRLVRSEKTVYPQLFVPRKALKKAPPFVFMLYLCAQMRKWAEPRHSQRNLLQLSACTVFCKVIIEDE